MKTSKNVLDKLIDEFSQTELKKRVWLITIIGFAICAITIALGYTFFHTEFVIGYGEHPVPYWKLLWFK